MLLFTSSSGTGTIPMETESSQPCVKYVSWVTFVFNVVKHPINLIKYYVQYRVHSSVRQYTYNLANQIPFSVLVGVTLTRKT